MKRLMKIKRQKWEGQIRLEKRARVTKQVNGWPWMSQRVVKHSQEPFKFPHSTTPLYFSFSYTARWRCDDSTAGAHSSFNLTFSSNSGREGKVVQASYQSIRINPRVLQESWWYNSSYQPIWNPVPSCWKLWPSSLLLHHLLAKLELA